MQILLGVLYHFIGGFASASFYLPYKKVRSWSWETYWLVGGIASWLLAPWIAAVLTVPDFMSIVRETPDSTVFWTYVMGLLWGIGGLTYGLTMRYLGLSLGVSVVLGFCSAFGALIPPIFRDIAGVEGETFSGLISEPGGQLVVLGVLVCLIGIAICGRAGVMKERELPAAEKTAAVAEFALTRGLTVAIISGILSACFNFGLEAGRPMAQMAEAAGANPLFRNNVVFVVVLWGGLTTNLLWCVGLAARNRSFGDYTRKDAPLAANYIFSFLAGTTWFLQFFFYGMGESKLSNGAASWILHMAFIIALGNVWGLLLKEWRGVSKRTLTTLFTGIGALLLSVVIVGYGNAL